MDTQGVAGCKDRAHVSVTMPVYQELGEGKKIEKDELLNDDEKTAVMKLRRRPLTDCSRLELRQLERHGCQQ